MHRIGCEARVMPCLRLKTHATCSPPPACSPLNKEKRSGNFKCAGCGAPLFTSTSKYNSGTGWPSFYQAIPGEQLSLGMYLGMPDALALLRSCFG